MDDDEREALERRKRLTGNRAYIRCKRCGFPGMTWAQQRQGYGKLLRSGCYSEAEARTLTPLCGKCATVIVRARRENGLP
jgi:hypothetical protein